MEKITSFTVDHTVLEPGIYVSRIDGDIITYDLRMKKPNTQNLLTNSQMHSFEHMLATYLRNSEIKDSVVYVGPMGCQTGFYVLVRTMENEEFLKVLMDCLEKIINHRGEMFGASNIECGNYKNLSVQEARTVAEKYLGYLKSKENTFVY